MVVEVSQIIALGLHPFTHYGDILTFEHLQFFEGIDVIGGFEGMEQTSYLVAWDQIYLQGDQDLIDSIAVRGMTEGDFAQDNSRLEVVNVDEASINSNMTSGDKCNRNSDYKSSPITFYRNISTPHCDYKLVV